MNVLITGGAEYIGSLLTGVLLRRGYRVLCFRRARCGPVWAVYVL